MSTRRNSSVGAMSLGDNAAHSLATMPAGATQKRASKRRQRALSGADRGPNGQGGAGVAKRAWYQVIETVYHHTWFLPALIMGVVFAVFYLMPDQSPANPLHQFLFLSYGHVDPTTGVTMYGKGRKDFAFVAFYCIFFTFFREFWMQVILRPLARVCGLKRKGKTNRFMEQSYSIVYYGLSAPFGLYIMYHTKDMWFFNTTAFYENYPHRTHEALFKVFYLLQAAFWTQQSIILMLQLEKPRKDFYELIFHHTVTIALIFLSYRFHFTWMGLAIYITMDFSDIFLALSKTLNYIDSPVTVPFFVLFVGVWVYARHYLNIVVLYSILTEFRTVGDFTLNWDTQQYKCWISQVITFALLLALQLVNCYWLFLIGRIAYRIAFQSTVADERSEDEDEDEAEEKKTR